MKLIFLNILVFMLGISNDPVFTKGKCYSGYIFDKSHDVLYSINNQRERFTPLDTDIADAETILCKGIKEKNKERINQIGNCPVIDKNLKKYQRQYLGFINLKGEKIIWINFIWGKTMDDKISKDVLFVNDGCSHYWNIKINLTTKELFDLDINGVS
jgi:hypothetical protein